MLEAASLAASLRGRKGGCDLANESYGQGCLQVGISMFLIWLCLLIGFVIYMAITAAAPSSGREAHPTAEGCNG